MASTRKATRIRRNNKKSKLAANRSKKVRRKLTKTVKPAGATSRKKK